MEAVIVALYAAIQVIDNLVEFGQDVGTLASGPSSGSEAQLAAVETALEGLAQEVQQCCTQILAALSKLDQEVFGNQMADELSYADQAGIALAEWEQNQSSAAQEQALNTSEAGLAGMVEEYSNNVYPGTSMMIVLARVMLQRMAVLTIFPTARAGADTQQFATALGYLTASTNTVAAYVQSVNQVHVTSQYVVLTGPTGKPVSHFYLVAIYYSNMAGDKTYSKAVEGATLQAAMQAAQPYIAEAEGVQAQGLAEDLAHAQVTSMEQIIQAVETFIG